jgi:hypothetical protein
VDQYTHRLLSTGEQDGHVVYEIESIPHEEAAVVWGKEVMTIRDDNVLLDHRFFDQDGAHVKSLTSLEIAEMGGRAVTIRQRMTKAEAPDEWTEVLIGKVEFDIELSDNVFTQSNLRNPRD